LRFDLQSQFAPHFATRLASDRGAETGDLTVIIPTLDEAAMIAATVRATRQIVPHARIIVADGGSADATVFEAQSAGAETISAARGRGAQMAAAAQLACTEWLLFLHADTQLPDNATAVIADFVRRPDARIATFRLRFDHAGWFLRACCWFTRFDSVFTRFGDQGILIRRQFYQELGGFPPWPLFEDATLLRRARLRARVWSLPAAVTTSARRFDRRGHFRQQLLNAMLLLRFLAGASPERLAVIYREANACQRTGTDASSALPGTGRQRY
jgi:rSAM/selenodomain-associated transferase 2